MKFKQTKTLMRSWCLMFLLMFLPASVLAQNAKKVTGTVIDETGEALIGATVTESGSAKGVITDFDGNFQLEVSSKATAIQVSYVGETVLQETVVIGYGVQRKSDLTGSVSNVSSKDFNQGVINSPEQLINGKVSGVQIVNGGGSPSAGSTIRIRGGASLNASNDPLIVLDGVPMEVGGSVSGSGNFLSLINPNDIESMTILKDASSSSLRRRRVLTLKGQESVSQRLTRFRHVRKRLI